MGFFDKMINWFNRQSGYQPTTGQLADSPSPVRAEPISIDEVLRKVEVYKRGTWMPVVDEESRELLASKIGGQPYLPKGDTPPVCPNCHKELTLFLQLNPQDLPADCDLDLEKDKLIQLFYCTSEQPHCEVQCEAYFPFSKSVLARSLPLPDRVAESPYPEIARQFEEKLITDWVRYDDYPDWHEMQSGGANLSENEIETLENSEAGIPKAADKLGGWPYWVQGVEYPSCPECGLQMQMIFQLDSQHHLPYMFGDAGIGHLHQCRLHKSILAFGWAGY